MKEEPLVSIVIPFYTGKQWLEEALESVTKQTYHNYEVLVVNDGSKEEIEDIKAKYQNKVTFFDKENGGPATARNYGIDKAVGKYIAFLDSDDIWLPEKLEKQVKLMEDKQAVWSQHSYEMFWENSEKTKMVNTSVYTGNVYQDCFISFKVQTSCVMVLRELLKRENIRFDPSKRYGQDCYVYRLLAKKYNIYSLQGVYARFRIRGNNAGFRAIVQINDRSSNWEEMKKDKELLATLPALVKLGYRITRLESKLIKKINLKNETVAKILYILPWSLFKMYAKKA